MRKNASRKPRTGKRAFLFIIFAAILVCIAAGWLFYSFYHLSPQFNYILVKKGDQVLKILGGETLQFHPSTKIRFLEISSNIPFNHGVRLTAEGVDINALFYEEMPFSTLLPGGGDPLEQNTLRVKVKRYNQDLGYVDLVVAPHVEDWIEKAERSVYPDRRIAILKGALKVAPEDKQIKGRLIEAYKSLKQWPEAASTLEEMAKENATREILQDLLEVYEADGNTDGVISVLRRLVKKDPADENTGLRLASTLEKAGKPKDAVGVYEGLLKRPEIKEKAAIYKALGFLHTRTGKNEEAISSYLKAVELDKNDVNIYYNLSLLYEQIGQKEKSDLYLSKAIGLKAEDMEGRLRLSESLIKKGELKDAERLLSEVLAARPDSMEALSLLVKVFEKTGDKNGLRNVYVKMLLLDPRNETISYNLGVLEYETGNLGNALSYFEKFLESHPKDAEAHNFLFDIYRRQEKDQLAYKEALSLILLNPKETTYYHYLFEYLSRHNNYPEIIDTMKKGLAYHPKDLDLRTYLVLAYLKTGKEALAVQEIKEILEIRPEDVKLLIQLAELEERLGRIKEALDAREKIMKIAPDNDEARGIYLRSMLQAARQEEEKGGLKDALAVYRKILDISPDNKDALEARPRLLIQVARGEEKQGNLREALTIYQEIMRISPGHQEAEESYLRLRLKVLPEKRKGE